MIDRPLADITTDDLQRLVANRVSEMRSLEYKQALPGNADADKKEFLADVSSFANAVGGDLLYGVTELRENGETTGIPESVDGLPAVNQDAEIRRLDSMLRDGIAPRLPGVQFRWVDGFPQGPVLIIRILRSWASPHMVTFKQHSRFYARNAGGKSALDVFELRSAFLNSGSLRERAREFRAERLGRLLAGDTPVRLTSARLTCVHLVPHAALAGATDVDLSIPDNRVDLQRPIYVEGGWSKRFNLDGLVAYSPRGDGQNLSYTQVFRSGILEAVSSELFGDWDGRGVMFPATAFVDELVPFLDRSRRLMSELAVEPPASLFVTVTGGRGATLAISRAHGFYREQHVFDRDEMLLRDVMLTDWQADIQAQVRPLLDELWQAAGFPRCLDYDEQGNWRPRR